MSNKLLYILYKCKLKIIIDVIKEKHGLYESDAKVQEHLLTKVANIPCQDIGPNLSGEGDINTRNTFQADYTNSSEKETDRQSQKRTE